MILKKRADKRLDFRSKASALRAIVAGKSWCKFIEREFLKTSFFNNIWKSSKINLCFVSFSKGKKGWKKYGKTLKPGTVKNGLPKRLGSRFYAKRMVDDCWYLYGWFLNFSVLYLKNLKLKLFVFRNWKVVKCLVDMNPSGTRHFVLSVKRC